MHQRTSSKITAQVRAPIRSAQIRSHPVPPNSSSTACQALHLWSARLPVPNSPCMITGGRASQMPAYSMTNQTNQPGRRTLVAVEERTGADLRLYSTLMPPPCGVVGSELGKFPPETGSRARGLSGLPTTRRSTRARSGRRGRRSTGAVRFAPRSPLRRRRRVSTAAVPAGRGHGQAASRSSRSRSTAAG